jgi:DNA-directed RNA polymerase specialized sigma subunit
MMDDNIPEIDNGGEKHPSPEQLILREAVSKALMNKQQHVWEMYNYDRLTHAEIAKKLKVNTSSVTRQIKTIEKQLKKWIKKYNRVYEVLRKEY